MPPRKNQLGLQEFNSPEYKSEHRFDITSMLEFSNQLQIISNSNNASTLNHKEIHLLLDNFIAQFEYLNDPNEREKLIQLMLVTLRKTDGDSNIARLPANNAMFLVFKFKKNIRDAIVALEANSDKTSLFIGDRQKQNSDKEKNLILLKSLEHNLDLVFNGAFKLYGMSIGAFLDRFDGHPLWRTVLTSQVLSFNSTDLAKVKKLL